MEIKNICKFTCEVYKDVSPLVKAGLKELGIEGYNLQSARSIVLREKKRFLGVSNQTVFEEDPLDIFKFHVPVSQEENVFNHLVNKAQLAIPGRGSIYCEEIKYVHNDKSPLKEPKINVISNEKISVQEDLTGICCIVQRGQGEEIVKTILDLGLCVPSVVYGIGTGLRDKLGLLRITIPAEKEVVSIVIDTHEANDVMNYLIDIGRLEQPGKGFIYTYPVKKGIINTKIFRGKMKYAANIEEIISVIDEIKGNSDWRKRDIRFGGGKQGSKRKYLLDMTDLSITCNEGKADDLVKAAMRKGAAGATISKLNHSSLVERQDPNLVSSAREKSTLIIGKNQIDAIISGLIEEGIFDESSSGMIEMKPIPSACTYLGSNTQK
jgi:nitrogen regulatory protein PII